MIYVGCIIYFQVRVVELREIDRNEQIEEFSRTYSAQYNIENNNVKSHTVIWPRDSSLFKNIIK
jgi:hypothetical protein